MKGIKGFQPGRIVSQETRDKIGVANSRQVEFICTYCGAKSSSKPSHLARKKRPFCGRECYSRYRAEILPKEEHNAFGHGHSIEERQIRSKARSVLNHAIRDGKVLRMPCEKCGGKSEAHHTDYSKPLEVVWLCRRHHWEEHRIYENPELLKD